MEGLIREGRSLAETPTWSVATVTTVMVFICLLVQRSLYKFGRWLKKTRRKALFASVEKIKEEMMLLGLISLLLGQWAGATSQICVDSSLFNSKFFLCSEEDYGIKEHIKLRHYLSLNETVIPSKEINHRPSQHCGEGREPFVSHEGLEQLHRFLFVLGITHVLYSCIAIGLAMTKIYSWRKWEVLASLSPDCSMQAKKSKVMRRQATFILHHATHPWSRSRILIWMLCFFKQFKSSMQKSDYFALRLGFITMFVSAHYGGVDVVLNFKSGEPWKKVFGPVCSIFFVLQMRTEVQSWPYNFPLSEDFPHSDQRGSVSGTLLVDDSYVSNHHILAVGAHIGLAPPGEVGSFLREGKGYQFWTNTNNEGHFLIENIRPGDYNLYAWVPGFIGDFRWGKLITVTPGGSIEAGTLLFKPPRDGPTLWEIGTPDRSAASYTQYIPSSAGTPARDCILLAACEAHETLPQSVEFPADIFTSCLTTPIKMALRW